MGWSVYLGFSEHIDTILNWTELWDKQTHAHTQVYAVICMHAPRHTHARTQVYAVICMHALRHTHTLCLSVGCLSVCLSVSLSPSHTHTYMLISTYLHTLMKNIDKDADRPGKKTDKTSFLLLLTAMLKDDNIPRCGKSWLLSNNSNVTSSHQLTTSCRR